MKNFFDEIVLMQELWRDEVLFLVERIERAEDQAQKLDGTAIDICHARIERDKGRLQEIFGTLPTGQVL